MAEAEPEAGVFLVRLHVQMRHPGDPLPAVTDLHDLVRFQLEGSEIDSDLGLELDDLIDPSSVRFTKVELTRLPSQAVQTAAEAFAEGEREGRKQLGAAIREDLDRYARGAEAAERQHRLDARTATGPMQELAAYAAAGQERVRAQAYREVMDLVHQYAQES